MSTIRPMSQATSQQPATESAGAWNRMAGSMSASFGWSSWVKRLGISDMVALVAGISLLIASVLFAFRWWRREPDYEFALREPILDDPAPSPVQPATIKAKPQPAVPPGFDTPEFLRYAKDCFKRMQAAWDSGDTGALKELTAPDVLAELLRQLSERKGATGHTEVALLNASLIGVQAHGADWVASVKFSGMIRTSANDIAAPFIEVWNLTTQESNDQYWTVSGIQQLQ